MAGWLRCKRQGVNASRVVFVEDTQEYAARGEEAEPCVAAGALTADHADGSAGAPWLQPRKAFATAFGVAALLGVAGVAVWAPRLAGGGSGGGSAEAAEGGEFARDFTLLPDTIEDEDQLPWHIRTNADVRHCVEAGGPLGRNVAIYHCNAVNPNQQWILEEGTGLLKSRYHPKCLKRSGKEVTMADCSEDDEDLKWERHPETKHLTDGNGECLDSFKGLHMQTCNNARLEQFIMYKVDHNVLKSEDLRWPSGPAHIKHAEHGFCLAYPSGKGMEVHSAPCDPVDAKQQWIWFPTTRQIMTYWHHRCLQAGLPDGPFAGMAIIGDCNAREERQLWHVTDKTKRHISVLGKCIHAEPGPMLQHCNSGTAEVWHIKPLEAWQNHAGGTNPDRDIHPFFDPTKMVVPPRLSKQAKNCHTGSPHVGKCGAERLTHPGAPDSKLWEKLRYEIWKISRQHQVVIHVGDHRGLLFRYGVQWENKPIAIASELKPITAVLAMRLVETGIIGLDDKVSRWLSYWPTATADSRSYVTLRHLLSFTSGFYGFDDVAPDTYGHNFEHMQSGTAPWFEIFCAGPSDDMTTCVKRILKHSKHAAPPGAIWTYTNNHLHIAAAMMEAATHKKFGELLHDHVFVRTAPGMVKTRKYARFHYWNPSSNAISTARDYQRFIDGYFNGLLVSNQSQHEIERDSQVSTRVRWFKGVATEGRPKDHGLFGLGWWRSRSTKTLCGVYQWCTFAPSHFASVAVVERKWAEFVGHKKCDWQRSSTCSFYFHFQNVNLLNSYVAKKKFRPISHIIERHAIHILSGRDPSAIWQ